MPWEKCCRFDGDASGRRIYAYANNDPLNLLDPYGLAACGNSSGPQNLTQLLGLILATEVAGLGPEDPAADAAVVAEFAAYESGAFAAAEGADVAGLLLPGSEAVGVAGSNASIRELPGGIQAAEGLFQQLANGGTAVEGSTYPGTLIQLQNGGTVGLRTIMTRSPGSVATIDINIPGISITKLKF